MKMISNNEIGVKHILTRLNQLKDKNSVFFKGTFNWAIYKHPPFPGSQIVYYPEENKYKFVKIPSDFLISSFSGFSGKEFIKEKTFCYAMETPYEVVIGRALWIEDLIEKGRPLELVESTVALWIDWYHDRVDEEREIFKALLKANRGSGGEIPLF
jgi:hypothetical protein